MKRSRYSKDAEEATKAYRKRKKEWAEIDKNWEDEKVKKIKKKIFK